MSEGTVAVLDGSTFVLGDRLGDVWVEESGEHGFVAVASEAHARRCADLARRPREDAAWDLGGILEEPAEVTDRAQLYREPEAICVAPP